MNDLYIDIQPIMKFLSNYVWYIIIVLCCTFIKSINHNRCPCEKERVICSPLIEKRSKYIYCFHNPREYQISIPNALNNTFVVNNLVNLSLTARCHIVVIITDGTNIDHFNKCPGNCSITPVLYLPFQYFRSPSFMKKPVLPLTCTYTTSFYLDLSSCTNEQFTIDASNNIYCNLVHLLHVLFFRRLYECYEQSHWNYIQTSLSYQIYKNTYNSRADTLTTSPILSTPEFHLPTNEMPPEHTPNIKSTSMLISTPIPRQTIYALVIWITSSTHRSFLFEKQFQSIQSSSHTGINAVIGWSADDSLYSCRENTTLCTAGSKNGDFMKMMPKTILVNNTKGEGWACAQRRPLRALAHTLLLYDPTVIIVADDDTFVNYSLLDQLYQDLIHNEMKKEPLVIGHYILKKSLTLRGLLFGGTGYIIGKKVITRLIATEIKYLRVPRRDKYATELILMNEIRRRNGSCDQPCLINEKPLNGSFYFHSTRLIDICMNIMASENTCYHSDYSISRCLIYGAHAEIIPIGCTDIDHPKMCSQNYSSCELHSHITCHHWMAGDRPGDPPSPIITIPS